MASPPNPLAPVFGSPLRGSQLGTAGDRWGPLGTAGDRGGTGGDRGGTGGDPGDRWGPLGIGKDQGKPLGTVESDAHDSRSKLAVTHSNSKLLGLESMLASGSGAV